MLAPDAPISMEGLPDGSRLVKWMAEALGERGKGARHDGAPGVKFVRENAAPGSPTEAYTLAITRGGIRISGDAAGLFYGTMSLTQLIAASPREDGRVRLKCLTISDAPRFAWRGFMLDESRYFAGETEVKRLLDAMARYKLNRFHWHLTDSPGWRLAIDAYPKLTEVGGRGNEGDPEGKGGARFYTKEQIRGIVKYAAERQIKVIPEIDLPGHADAAVRAYPELDGGGYQKPASPGKWPRFTYNPGSPAVWEFRDKVFREVAELFPDAGMIHFGGDEVHFGWGAWQTFPEVRQLMTRESLADNAAVERWFARETAASLYKLGVHAACWDEITGYGLPADRTTVFWWRHDKPEVLKDALAAGYPVVLCPRRPLYFDFIQNAAHKSGRTWNGFNPIEDVYAFPDTLGLSPEQERQVVGMQACLWTENAASRERREFLVWPRLIAMAESAWTPKTGKSFAGFQRRLHAELPVLRGRGIVPYDPFLDSPEIAGDQAKPVHLDRPQVGGP
ncbi:beta-hexosaminidase [Luteolibacter sp. LG18]|nr:beta-hexosaminidase [Luteolibacter sp. LG18]